MLAGDLAVAVNHARFYLRGTAFLRSTHDGFFGSIVVEALRKADDLQLGAWVHGRSLDADRRDFLARYWCLLRHMLAAHHAFAVYDQVKDHWFFRLAVNLWSNRDAVGAGGRDLALHLSGLRIVI